MSWKTRLTGVGLAAALAASFILSDGMPASASSSTKNYIKSSASDSGFAPQGSGGSFRPMAPDEMNARDKGIIKRINELVAAYDSSAKAFHSNEVSAATLESDEGQAFVAALAPRAADATSASVEIESSFAALRQALIESGAPATKGADDDPSTMSYSLAPGVTFTGPSTTGITTYVSGGADPWPYVQLTGAEQQAMVTGASATLVVAICALLGPASAGVGCGVGAAVIGTIVGIIVANGVCANNAEMRIYPLLGPAGFSCQ